MVARHQVLGSEACETCETCATGAASVGRHVSCHPSSRRLLRHHTCRLKTQGAVPLLEAPSNSQTLITSRLVRHLKAPSFVFRLSASATRYPPRCLVFSPHTQSSNTSALCEDGERARRERSRADSAGDGMATQEWARLRLRLGQPGRGSGGSRASRACQTSSVPPTPVCARVCGRPCKTLVRHPLPPPHAMPLSQPSRRSHAGRVHPAYPRHAHATK